MLEFKEDRASMTQQDAQKTQIFCIGINHHGASLELRENFFLADEVIEGSLPKVCKLYGLDEAFVVSTCNRFELYGVFHERSREKEQILECFLGLQKNNPIVFTPQELKKFIYIHEGKDAVRHLFRVTASLDSLVVGETQITGQVKSAVERAVRTKTLGSILLRLTSDAFEATKKVRSRTDIGKGRVSIGHAAISLAGKVFGDLSRHKFLIIGAGEMAKVTAKHILTYKPLSLTVANRTRSKAQSFVEEIGFGTAADLENLEALIADTDIVISSTAAQDFILTHSLIAKVQEKRKFRSLLLVDVALPRDIEPRVKDLSEVYLFDIDDLKQVADQNTAERQKASLLAKDIIEDHILKFEKWLSELAIKPMLGLFRQFVDDLIEGEKKKSFSKDALKDLSQAQKTILDDLLKSLAAKLSAEVGIAIKKSSDEMARIKLCENLDQLFSLTERQLQPKNKLEPS